MARSYWNLGFSDYRAKKRERVEELKMFHKFNPWSMPMLKSQVTWQTCAVIWRTSGSNCKHSGRSPEPTRYWNSSNNCDSDYPTWVELWQVCQTGGQKWLCFLTKRKNAAVFRLRKFQESCVACKVCVNAMLGPRERIQYAYASQTNHIDW